MPNLSNHTLSALDLAHIWHPCTRIAISQRIIMPNLSNHTLSALDLAHIWHPCTQMKDHEDFPIVPIKSAKGVYLYDFDGSSYIDCISSWWVNLFGHCNAAINAAITNQLNELEHILLAGFSHKPIIDLSQRLCALLPHPLNKCFYADNGSSAIEIALKMSFHYHHNLHRKSPPRSKFLALSNAYHGETIGALSVGDLGLYKHTYAPILLSCLSVPVPNVFDGTKRASLHAPAELEDESYYERELHALESILSRYGEEICAFIVEPLVQCAGNMHIYPKAFIKKACELCRSYGSQLNELEHILLAGFSHKPIIDLSQRLCALLPRPLNKCFYADNGSSAIEIALKMSFHYHHNLHRKSPPRSKFLALSNAYHGETIGALSVGDLGLYKHTYAPILLSCLSVPVPNVFDGTKGASLHAPAELEDESYYERELHALESILSRYGEEICAFILEPLVQCAGNMHIYPKAFIKKACELCRSYGILIIFDEIAVGFGRSGSMFALEQCGGNMHIYPKAFIKKACELCRSYGILIIFDEIAVGFGRSGSMFALEQCGITPDFLCLSKGITGGYLPLSVVVTSDEIYQAFYAPYESGKAFLHSHSYTGNALACAAANAVLDIFATQNIIEQNRALSRAIFALWQELEELNMVKNLRHCGMIFAFEIDSSTPRAGVEIFRAALAKGLLLRPLGHTIYFMPPYIITIEEARFSTPRAGVEIFRAALAKGLLLRPLGHTIYFMPPYIITIEEARFVVQTLKEYATIYHHHRRSALCSPNA